MSLRFAAFPGAARPRSAQGQSWCWLHAGGPPSVSRVLPPPQGSPLCAGHPPSVLRAPRPRLALLPAPVLNCRCASSSDRAWLPTLPGHLQTRHPKMLSLRPIHSFAAFPLVPSHRPALPPAPSHVPSAVTLLPIQMPPRFQESAQVLARCDILLPEMCSPRFVPLTCKNGKRRSTSVGPAVNTVQREHRPCPGIRAAGCMNQEGWRVRETAVIAGLRCVSMSQSPAFLVGLLIGPETVNHSLKTSRDS